MDYEKERLFQRVQELEEKINHLRISRRVLMNLLEKVEKEKASTIHSLEKALEKERSNKRRLIRSNPNFKLLHVVSMKEYVSNIENGMPDNYINDPDWLAEKELMLNNPVERIKADIEQDDIEEEIKNAPLSLEQRVNERWFVSK